MDWVTFSRILSYLLPGAIPASLFFAVIFATEKAKPAILNSIVLTLRDNNDFVSLASFGMLVFTSLLLGLMIDFLQHAFRKQIMRLNVRDLREFVLTMRFNTAKRLADTAPEGTPRKQHYTEVCNKLDKRLKDHEALSEQMGEYHGHSDALVMFWINLQLDKNSNKQQLQSILKGNKVMYDEYCDVCPDLKMEQLGPQSLRRLTGLPK